MRYFGSVLFGLFWGLFPTAPIVYGNDNNCVNKTEFTLTEGYQSEDGSITVLKNGSVIDPYFATKALLIAKDGGLDISKIGKLWVDWVIKKQREDGLFERYCLINSEWDSCAAADADDSLLGLWVELLYTLSPQTGLSDKWKQSVIKAERQLDSLYNTEIGTYNISTNLPVSLLMDNIEIYRAFRNIGVEANRIGNNNKAREFNEKAIALRKGIIKQFWQPKLEEFLISTQEREKSEFYPDDLAQIYPLIHKMPYPQNHRKGKIYSEWLANNKEKWINYGYTDYPWGLVAVAALNLNDRKTAFCWHGIIAKEARSSSRWNVLEEAAFQHIAAHAKTQFKPEYLDHCFL